MALDNAKEKMNKAFNDIASKVGNMSGGSSSGQAPSSASLAGKLLSGGSSGSSSSGSLSSDMLSSVQKAVNNLSSKTGNASGGSSSSVGSSGGSYTPVGTYNDYGISEADRRAIESCKAEYHAAYLSGDTEGMQRANDRANGIRAKYGYSGGVDGSQYISLPDREPEKPINQYQYTGYDDFYKQSGYDNISKNLESANNYYLQQVLNNMESQKGKLNQAADDQAKQAYVSYMMSKKALPQQLAAQGYNGGMADSQKIALDANYQNTHNDIEQNRLNALNDIDTNMNNARLESYANLAEQNAALGQNAISDWNNYTNMMTQLENSNFWNGISNKQWQQSFDESKRQFDETIAIQKQNPYFTYVMDKISKGVTPTDEELLQAGIPGISPAELIEMYKRYVNLDLTPT